MTPSSPAPLTTHAGLAGSVAQSDCRGDATRRDILRLLGVSGAAVVAGVAGSGCSRSSKPTVAGAPPAAEPVNMATLIQQARAEGGLNLVAVPTDWANYGEIIAGFAETYGITPDVALPQATSQQVLQLVQDTKDAPEQPDCIDIGYTVADQAIADGLVAPYMPSTVQSVPAPLRNDSGYSVGSYFGVLEIGVNPDAVQVPASLDDLKKSAYRGKIALPGNPRTSATSMVAMMLANRARGGGFADISLGIEFFNELATQGNLVYVDSVSESLAAGQIAVGFDWNYNFVAARNTFVAAGFALKTLVPQGAAVGTYFTQSLVAGSPHPAAGRLWIEWLLSDKAAELFAQGGMVPARYAELRARGILSGPALRRLPQQQVLDDVAFPTTEEARNAQQELVRVWPSPD